MPILISISRSLLDLPIKVVSSLFKCVGIDLTFSPSLGKFLYEITG